MTTLQCIRDLCLKDNQFVNYLKCTECQFFLGQQKIGTIDCKHPQAEKGKNKGYQGELKDIYPVLLSSVRIGR